MMDLKPLADRIITQTNDPDQVGGIWIPDKAKQGEMKSTEGKVIAIGDQVEGFKAGDTVYWGRYSGTELKRNGSTYWIMNESDVLCLVENNSKPQEEK